jgi:hypothetical protein
VPTCATTVGSQIINACDFVKTTSTDSMAMYNP